MDPIADLSYKKDSTLAMLFEAQKRNFELYYLEQTALFLEDGKVFAKSILFEVMQNSKKWYHFKKEKIIALNDMQVILMRKDPPVDQHYLYTTQLLDLVEQQGTLVVNRPQSLRDANEKLFACHFPKCTPKTLVTSDLSLLMQFTLQEKDIICKPLSGMGGRNIFRIKANDDNAASIFETLTQQGNELIMVQQYISAIKKGDKRIILINGEPIGYALARIPAKGEFRGNLRVGAKACAKPLSKQDRVICNHIAPVLQEKGLYFVGIDVIGEYLTEINVTSPTGIRELDDQCNINIASILFDFIKKKLSSY